VSDLIETSTLEEVAVEDTKRTHRLHPPLLRTRHKLRRPHTETAVSADSGRLRARLVSLRTPDRDGSRLATASARGACAPLLLRTQTASRGARMDTMNVRFILTSGHRWVAARLRGGFVGARTPGAESRQSRTPVREAASGGLTAGARPASLASSKPAARNKAERGKCGIAPRNYGLQAGEPIVSSPG
jgi:hypothetical protein